MFAKSLLLPLVLAAALAPSARAASDIELRFGKRTSHGFFGIQIGSGERHGRERECEPSRYWVPAHFEARTEKVWIEGREEQVWIAPVYDWRYDKCGRPYRVQLEVGHWACVRAPGRFECRETQVWVCGRWVEGER